MMTVRHAYTHFSVTCKNNNLKETLKAVMI